MEGEEPITVKEVSESRKVEWKLLVLGDGAKKAILGEIDYLHAYRSRNGIPEDVPVRFFIRKNSDGQIKFEVSNAPEDIPLSELCETSILRWPIELCFQETKNHFGMDQ